MSLKQILSQFIVAVGAVLFSQCKVAWTSFLQARVQGVEVLILLGALFLPSVAPSSLQDFLYTELTFCFCTLLIILDPLPALSKHSTSKMNIEWHLHFSMKCRIIHIAL
jgi:hypothetical protein